MLGEQKVVTSIVIDETGQALAPDEDLEEIVEYRDWLATYETDRDYEADDE